jgi:hypothetical protein
MLIGFVLFLIFIWSGALLLGLCRAAQRADAAEEQSRHDRAER